MNDDTKIVSTTLPATLASAIDRRVRHMLSSRSAWLRQAAYAEAARQGIIRDPATQVSDPLELEKVVG